MNEIKPVNRKSQEEAIELQRTQLNSLKAAGHGATGEDAIQNTYKFVPADVSTKRKGVTKTNLSTESER